MPSNHLTNLAATAIAALTLTSAPASAATAGVELMDPDGEVVGQATLGETPNGVLVSAELKGLEEGAHAFHIHETGACSPDFEAAGGHYNPDGADHGLNSETGPHAGDFPNIHVPSYGALKFEALNTVLELDERPFDDDGAAIVIHAGADDYMSEPAGDAGKRIACGVLEQ